MARVVYLGTPAFAVPPLRVLLEEGHAVAAVVTQPDRPAGRSGAPGPSPVKVYAREQGLTVWQPQRLRGEAIEQLRALAPDIIIVAAYGEILHPSVLEIPPHGCLNLHASLLPRHRGAAPVAAAILAGDAETGITLMQMDAGMDTGAIVAQEKIALTGGERQGELTARLADLGAGLLRRVLPAWLAGEITPQPQDESQATYCLPLRREDGQIDWTWPASLIERMTRAYDPWPGAYTFLRGRRLRLWQVRVIADPPALAPGVLIIAGRRLIAGTGEGALLLEQVQLEGKRRMSAEEFLCGQHGLEGTCLGA